MADYAIVKLRMRAVIDGRDFGLVQFASTFALNQIPVASLTLPIGRNLANDQLLPIHEAVEKFNIQLPVKVYMTATVTDREGATVSLPNGKEILVFDGDLVGTGWQRMSDSAGFTFHALHWLARLDYSSAVSASSHPGNPADWTYPSIFRALGLGADAQAGVEQADPAWIPMINASAVTTASLTDIWGKVIHPWMVKVSKDDPFDRNMVPGPIQPDPLIQDAISRIGPNPDGVPLDLETSGGDADRIAGAIRRTLQRESGASWINNTLWGKLIGDWAPSYLFSVVPRVSDALIVPFTGPLRGQEWATIRNSSYHQTTLQGQLHRVLRAVGIVTPVSSGTGADGGLGQIVASRGGCAGFYRPNGVNTGVVLLKDAPRWLSDTMREYDFVAPATGAGREVINTDVDIALAGAIITTSTDPVVIAATAAANAAAGSNRLGAAQTSVRRIMDRYAQQLYCLEALKGRMGELSGKLRFDIAPGSTVAIDAGRLVNVPAAQDGLAKKLYAQVMQVAYIANAETKLAGTAITVTHQRTERENSNDSTSIDRPPLYKRPWFGAAMIPGVTPEL